MLSDDANMYSKNGGERSFKNHMSCKIFVKFHGSHSLVV